MILKANVEAAGGGHEERFAQLEARIGRVEADLQARIARVEADLQARIARVESNLQTRMGHLQSTTDVSSRQTVTNSSQ